MKCRHNADRLSVMTDFLLILPWGLLGGCVVGFLFLLAKRRLDVQTAAPELADLRGQLSMLSQTNQQQQTEVS